jgi:selenide,water dikinase
MNPPVPIRHAVVLVGAGNAHLVFARRWRMRPEPGVSVALVSDSAAVAYSAMIPAHLADEYGRDEVTLDLVRFCRSAGVRLAVDRVVRIDPPGKRVLFADRPPLAFDTLSVAVGSTPTRPAGKRHLRTLQLRPLGKLLAAVDEIDAELAGSHQSFHLAIIGGGASGCELAVALARRLGRHPGFRATVLQGGAKLLPQFPGGAGAAFEKALRDRGIGWRVNARVIGEEPGGLVLETGERVPCDAALWATDAAAPPLLCDSGLPTDPAGFLRVSDTLQSVSDPAVFGAGDCVSFDRFSELPRNGVYAVRQGAALFENVVARIRGAKLRPFRPQRRCLYLLNTGDGRAVLNYGPLVWTARWARRWKERIDRRWVRTFEPMAMPAATEDEPAMRCGGCGSKVPGDVLAGVLRGIEVADDPRVLLGLPAAEDAAVFRSAPGQPAEVQTVDYFKSFTDDPYLFGRVAALNAVSDLYAMNARPFAALAIATVPHARGRVQESLLRELMAGAQRTLREEGVTLAGGHTTEGAELALGFSVTGHAEESALFRKGGLRPNDKLILTKPLGSGALLAAWMRGECRAEWYEPLVSAMLQSNRAASAVFAQLGVRACTDVTGFGLAGHLLEMLDASGVSARLFADRVPLYAGFREVVAKGMVSTLHPGNARANARVRGAADPPAWLFDPQTSGGLLAGIAADRAEEALRLLPGAAVIGEVIAAEPGIELVFDERVA